MKISKKAEYGLRAMLYLAQSNKKKKITPLKEIAEKERMPFDFLEKIFGKLEKSGLVKAKKGSLGGYFLGRPASKITPGDIVMVLEENMAKIHCSGCSMAGGCSSEDVWSEVQESLDGTLNAVTLADLIKKK